MTRAFVLTIAVPLALFMAGNSKPYSREAAEKSFRALVAAKDSDILDVIKSDGLVCFADSLPLDHEDRFLTLKLPKPTAWFQEKTNSDSGEEQGSIYDGKSDLPATSPASLSLDVWVNQDSTGMVHSFMDGRWHSYGHYERKNGKTTWKPFGDQPPVFRFSQEKDEITGATNISAMEDDTNFYASKKFENRNSGTTTYEMSVRLSTGRYKEVWTPDKGEPIESVGNCYKAKEFVRPTSPKKK